MASKMPMLAVMLFLTAATATAQQNVTSATLSGTIEDMQGAVVTRATVTVTRLDQNQSCQANSDDQGRYRFAYLPVGRYQLKAEREGFATFVVEMSLSVGQTLDVPIRLGVVVSERIDVHSDVPTIETARTQVSETILPKEVDSLPLNGRNYLDLAALTPGVARANAVGNQRFAETSAVPGTAISVTGQRNINNGFLLDGVSANDDAADLPATFFSQDVIHEFQVITSGGIAEYGRASAGIINVVTQSGTNEWHGRLYGFLRNQRFDARNPLARTKDPLTQAQYGATGGGPILKDRTFVFANFEQTRLHNAVVLTITPASVLSINDILNRVNYPGSRVETGLAPAGYNTSNVFVRLDHRINPTNLVSARYSYYDISSLNARNVGGINAVSRGTPLDDRDQSIVLSDVATISPRFMNEARFQYTRSRLGAPPNDFIGPAVSISGVANIGTATSSPTERDIDAIEAVDNVTMQRGNHSLKFGLDFLLNRVDIEFPGALQGVYTFSSLANFVRGQYVSFQQAFGAPGQFQSNPNIGFFVQDEWRLKNFTVNLGLRYDLQSLPDPVRTDTNNISPRLGIAYSPGDHKTVIRASYGTYYDRIPLRATSNALQRDGSKYLVAVIPFGQPSAPLFPNTLPAFPSGLLASITTIDPDIENSNSLRASLQVEREIASSTSLSVGYIYVRSLHVILSRNINVPTVSAAEAAQRGIANLGRPDARFANISRYESSGDAYYNGLTVSLNRRFRSWAGIRLSYTFSKAIDDTGSAFFSTPQNNFNLRDDRGLSDNDQCHRLVISGALSSPNAVAGQPLWRQAVSGFQLSYIFSYGSSLPFNIVTGNDRNNDTTVNDRPVGVGRNAGIGFDFASLDMRLSRHFRFTERFGLDALAEGFNLLNRANLQLPNATFGPGTVPPAAFGAPTAAADPRQIQFGLRFTF
jgi:hypothetical protein